MLSLNSGYMEVIKMGLHNYQLTDYLIRGLWLNLWSITVFNKPTEKKQKYARNCLLSMKYFFSSVRKSRVGSPEKEHFCERKR